MIIAASIEIITRAKYRKHVSHP